jgi:hypothetical protein
MTTTTKENMLMKIRSIKKFTHGVLAIFLCGTGIQTASAQIVLNGSFETTTTANFTYGDTDDWTGVGPRGITVANGGSFSAPATSNGSQMAFMQSSGLGSEVTLYQNITFASAGLYQLTFDAANRAGNALNFQYVVDLGVSIIGSGTLTSTSLTTQTINFNVAAPGTFGFQLRDDPTLAAGTSDVFFDNISIVAIPEPSSIALLLAATAVLAVPYLKHHRSLVA